MYSFHIADMTNRIVNSLGLGSDDRQKVSDALSSYWADKIALVWTVEDVRACKKDISDADAVLALLKVADSHDANLGVNWDTIVAACGGEYPDDDDIA